MDPACAACEQLLAEMEKEDEADLEVEATGLILYICSVFDSIGVKSKPLHKNIYSINKATLSNSFYLL